MRWKLPAQTFRYYYAEKIMRLLSPVNILKSLVTPAALLLILVLILTTSNHALTATSGIVAFIFFLILSTWIYNVLAHTYDLYYDQQYVHLKGIRKRKSVPLAHVKSIRRANGYISLAGFHFHRHTLAFDPATDVDDQTVYLAGAELDLFIKTVRQCNKHIIVK